MLLLIKPCGFRFISCGFTTMDTLLTYYVMPPQDGCLGTLRQKIQVHFLMDIKFLICQKFFYI